MPAVMKGEVVFGTMFWVFFLFFEYHKQTTACIYTKFCVVSLFLLQGNKGNPGPVGPPGIKGDGFPGPQVRGNSHQN